jgi:hypothetical protein
MRNGKKNAKAKLVAAPQKKNTDIEKRFLPTSCPLGNPGKHSNFTTQDFCENLKKIFF